MRYLGKRFENEDVPLSGNEYHGCTFVNCRIIFTGASPDAPTGLKDCAIHSDCVFAFEGPAGATLAFLDMLYHNLGPQGRELVEKTFRNIKRGVYAKPGSHLSN